MKPQDLSHFPAGFESYFCSRTNTFRRRTASKITDSIVPTMGLTMLKTRSKNIDSSSRTTLLLSSSLEKNMGDFFGEIKNFHWKVNKKIQQKNRNFLGFSNFFWKFLY